MSGLILASASPRRRELLEQIKIIPIAVIPADINEDELRGELPRDYVKRITIAKAEKISLDPKAKGHFILSADTTVACGRKILPKSEDRKTAETCLRTVSGRRHKILGGICVISPDGRKRYRCVETTVKFKCLTEREINAYLDSQEWAGKAGGYGIQGLASRFVTFLQGSYSNVVGLSLYDTAQLLKGLGYDLD